MDNKPIRSEDFWDKVRMDYLSTNYKTVQDLCEKWDINYNTLNDRIYKGVAGQKPWKEEKKILTKELLDVAIQKTQSKYISSFILGADIVEQALSQIQTELVGSNLTPLEKGVLAKTAMDCISKMQGIVRLENNQSTQNVAVQHIKRTGENLKDAINTLEDLGIVEVDPDKS